jgi:hypothetical protein
MGASAIWSSNSIGCERDHPFEVQCQTAVGSRALDKPGCPVEGSFLSQRRISLNGSTRRSERGRRAGSRRKSCSSRNPRGLPFGNRLRGEQRGHSTQVATRWSRADQHRQVSSRGDAVAMNLKKALGLSTLGSSQATETVKAACLDKNDLATSMELARELISAGIEGLLSPSVVGRRRQPGCLPPQLPTKDALHQQRAGDPRSNETNCPQTRIKTCLRRRR